MDKNKLFVGGLPWSITNDTFAELFAQYGEIVEAVVITDRDTGRSKGFGFVTFKNEEDAQKALEMDGQEVQERKIVVNVAKPRENRTGGGGFNRDNSRGDRRNY
ncbi:RNA-binding protein [Candidatus Roizmanbacteria bacterium CG_4_9_14_0_2_um_filter_39_13]|uniref:RNA-binding protein n=1 Tax=Candidatus Roizmanbacteria bacterium CG_4_9_14_0_2_um_filter_39_13 TaxID=1974839 RepID=A0A2M8EX97_9BACT|nr:MAG: RNA-binding protein [Candidatus Roizmanbacteria bacterium CG_4_10_14_0_2_um_filter_39_12]PJC30504.1 MAG: RNA-binding protein [Candidatus Roizmanbacteria bacterium CG_4_9_14_0_2_um_filter_39_13]